MQFRPILDTEILFISEVRRSLQNCFVRFFHQEAEDQQWVSQIHKQAKQGRGVFDQLGKIAIRMDLELQHVTIPFGAAPNVRAMTAFATQYLFHLVLREVVANLVGRVPAFAYRLADDCIASLLTD